MLEECTLAFTSLVLLFGLAAGESRAQTAERLRLGEPVHHVDRLAREPMVVEHPGGALFVAGFGSQVTGTDPRATPHLWKSLDGGATWSRVDVGPPESGAIGNSDVDLAVAPDGTLYFASMGFNRSTFDGTHVAMGVSRDVGSTWQWTLLSESHGDDRPWVVVRPDGGAHVVWNDGSGVSHATSVDGGRTWKEQRRAYPRGGSSHFAVGSKGELALRVTPLSASGKKLEPEVERILVSGDAGKSWSEHEPPGEIEWTTDLDASSGVPRWVEPLAWDASGDLFHLWSEGRQLRLGRSSDRGASWSVWEVALEDETAYFPYLTARGAGELAASWFTGRGASMRAHVARIDVPESAEKPLRLRRSDPFLPDSWLERPGPRVPTPAGEYIPVIFLSGGGLGLVTPIQDLEGGRFGFSWWRVEG
jgi:hypothetical protein